MLIKTIGDFRRAIRNGAYAWPGGYPCFVIMADGEAMSFAAAKTGRRRILTALRDVDRGYRDAEWTPAAFDINWGDASLTCAHTERIQSAYAEEPETCP